MAFGKCDSVGIDTIDCGFDAGGCLAFNLSYPLCNVIVDAYKVGDGKCNTCRLGKTISVPFLGKGFDVDLVRNGFCNGGV